MATRWWRSGWDSLGCTLVVTRLNKTQQAVSAFEAGNVKEALKIASGFRIGVTKEERSVMKTGYECIVHPEFYQQLGKDLDACIHRAAELFSTKFVSKCV